MQNGATAIRIPMMSVKHKIKRIKAIATTIGDKRKAINLLKILITCVSANSISVYY